MSILTCLLNPLNKSFAPLTASTLFPATFICFDIGSEIDLTDLVNLISTGFLFGILEGISFITLSPASSITGLYLGEILVLTFLIPFIAISPAFPIA